MDQKESLQKPQDATLSREELAKNFGESLRQSREAVGYSLERAAIATKISLSFIQALESGELHRLPGSVFARGFIRNLCKIYQKDAASFLDAFEMAVGHTATAPVSTPTPATAAPSGERVDSEPVSPVVQEAVSTHMTRDEDEVVVENASNPAKEKIVQQLAAYREKWAAYLPLLRTQRYQLIAGAGVGAVLVTILTFFVTDPNVEEAPKVAQQSQPSEMPVVMEEQPPAPQGQDGEKVISHSEPLVLVAAPEPVIPSPAPANPTPPAGEPAVKTPAPVQKIDKVANIVVNEEKVKKNPTSAVKPEVVATHKPEAARPIPAGTRQTLEIFARQRVVVRLTKDGGAPQNLTLEPKQHSFEFRDEAQVLIFDASVVDVKYNGRSLGPLGKSGRVRRLSFKREELPVHAKM